MHDTEWTRADEQSAAEDLAAFRRARRSEWEAWVDRLPPRIAPETHRKPVGRAGALFAEEDTLRAYVERLERIRRREHLASLVVLVAGLAALGVGLACVVSVGGLR